MAKVGDDYRVCTQTDGGTSEATWTPPAGTDGAPLAGIAGSVGAKGLIVVDDGEYLNMWIGTGRCGVMFLDTENGTTSSKWVQMEEPGNDDMSTWWVRSLMRDPMDTGDVSMFYGVWQEGLYHYNADSSKWFLKITGLDGGEGPGGKGGFLNLDTGELYHSNYQNGIFRLDATASNPTYSAIGESNTTVSERASYAKSFNNIGIGPDTGDSVYFAGARWWNQYDFDGSNHKYFGGLYQIDLGDGKCTEVGNWDGDGSMDDWKWDINRIVSDTSADTVNIYVATGEAGVNAYPVGWNMTKHMIRRGYLDGSSVVWAGVIDFLHSSYPYVAPLGVDPYPCLGNTNHLVISGLGNTWNWHIGSADSDTLGKVFGPVPYGWSDCRTLIGSGLRSVFDVEAVPREESTNNDSDYVVWAATANFSQQEFAQGHLGVGGLYKIEVYDSNPCDDTTNVSPITNENRAYTCVEYVDFHNMRLLSTVSLGINASGDFESKFWLGNVNENDDITQWHDYGQIEVLDENNAAVNFMPKEIFGAIETNDHLRFFLGGPTIFLDFPVQSYNLTDNVWSWISSNRYPAYDSLSALMVTCDSLQQMQDQYHNRYAPTENPPVDSIYVWNPLMGYGIRTRGNDTFENFGAQIPSDTTIMLYPAPQDSSWIYNYIAYLPTDTMDTYYAFVADSDTVIIVKNDDGEFWRPEDEEEDKFDMYPGEGYQVGVSDTMSYAYPDPPGGASAEPPKAIIPAVIACMTPSHFQATQKTGDFYPIYIEDLLVNGTPPAFSDEVGCFTEDNLCVGAGVYDGDFPIKIAAWKDDPYTEAVDGYEPDETLSFKFFDVSAGLEVELGMQAMQYSAGLEESHAYTQFEQGFFARHYLEGSYVIPGSYELAQNYPNPFNPITNIKYNLPFESIVKLEVFDVMGRKVITLVDRKQSAGFRSVRWDSKNSQGALVSSGVYFYKLKTEATTVYLGRKEKFEKVKKMVMIK